MQEFEIKSSVGLFPPRKNVHKSFKFQYQDKEVIGINPEIELLRLQVTLNDFEKRFVELRMKTISNVLAYLGGLFKGVSMFFLILVWPVREVLYYKKIINSLFTVCLDFQELQKMMGAYIDREDDFDSEDTVKQVTTNQKLIREKEAKKLVFKKILEKRKINKRKISIKRPRTPQNRMMSNLLPDTQDNKRSKSHIILGNKSTIKEKDYGILDILDQNHNIEALVINQNHMFDTFKQTQRLMKAHQTFGSFLKDDNKHKTTKIKEKRGQTKKKTKFYTHQIEKSNKQTSEAELEEMTPECISTDRYMKYQILGKPTPLKANDLKELDVPNSQRKLLNEAPDKKIILKIPKKKIISKKRKPSEAGVNFIDFMIRKGKKLVKEKQENGRDDDSSSSMLSENRKSFFTTKNIMQNEANNKKKGLISKVSIVNNLR